jgi:hypothetical protein
VKRKLRRHAAPIGLVVGLVLVALVGWLGFVAPQRSKAAGLQSQIDSAQTQLMSLRLKPKGATPSAKLVRVADIFRLSKAIPDKVEMPDVLLELNRVAGESGVTFESITPHETIFQPTYQVVPVDVVFQGNYYDLSEFLYRLRNMVEVHDGRLVSTGRLFTVDRVSFNEGASHFPQIEASLSINAFVYGPGSAAAVPGATTTTTTTTTPATSTAPAPPTTSTTAPVTTPPAPSGASATGATP